MRKTWPWIAVVGATFASVTGGASPVEPGGQIAPMPPSGTNLYGTDGTETSATLLSFTCSYAWEGFQFDFHTVSCRFATTDITRPSGEQLAERLRALDALEHQAEVESELAERCKARDNSPDPKELTFGPQRTYAEKLSAACASGDLAAGKAALAYEATEVWAKTCEAVNYGARQYEFQMVDESTWRAMEGAPVGSAANIKTIWRKKSAHEFAPWNVKQVTSADPTCTPAPFNQCAEDATEEWTREAPVKLVGCQFFR